MENYKNKYKESLERANKELTACGSHDCDAYRQIVRLFPELKENEDERIRENCIHFLELQKQHHAATFEIEECIAWLEKQNESTFLKNIQIGDKVTRNEDGILVNLSQLNRVAQKPNEQKPTKEYDDERIRKTIIEFITKQKEERCKYKGYGGLNWNTMLDWLEKQKSVETSIDYTSVDPHFEKPIVDDSNKVEPKFEVGDFVVHDMSDGRKVVRQIVNMTNKSYVLDGEDFNTFYFKDLEDSYHLWTIEDVKDGDILKEKSCIFIMRKLYGIYISAKPYCILYDNGEFNNDALLYFENESIKPATKEQRDFLFSKMKEAGYEWDAEKKELIVIKQKPVKENSPIHSNSSNTGKFTEFKNALVDVCKGWVGYEIGWEDYIYTNADALLRISQEMWNEIQDVPFENDYPKIKGWVARDEDGCLYLYDEAKPIKNVITWSSVGDCVNIDAIWRHYFTEVNWKDEEPTEVELIIKKV